jgi:DNA-binding NarL/FixJ family response regulator
MNRALEVHLRLMQQLPVRHIPRRETPKEIIRASVPPSERRKRIAELRAAGVSSRKTAQIIGISRGAVQDHWRALDKAAKC